LSLTSGIPIDSYILRAKNFADHARHPAQGSLKQQSDEPGRWPFHKLWVCGPTVTAGRSNFGLNSRVLGLGVSGRHPAIGVRRHGLISLPSQNGLLVAGIMRRSVCNVPR
jgi:hypothetical protein